MSFEDADTRIKKEILERLDAAKDNHAVLIERLRWAEEDVERSRKKLDILEIAKFCEHDWEDLGGFIFLETRCKKCGYVDRV